jgi:hypothetical protein
MAAENFTPPEGLINEFIDLLKDIERLAKINQA